MKTFSRVWPPPNPSAISASPSKWRAPVNKASNLCAAIPNFGEHVESTIEDDPWTRNLYEPALEVQDGKVAVPANPGWGVKIGSDWLAKARREVSERA